eukprot:c4748_g1_i1.p1 GENE.c4748_g1_i1~~c4748_g1_i1.p1  ORF type:complete len:434 (+),score=82.15 c4748_g1_i1:69-1370(+)
MVQPRVILGLDSGSRTINTTRRDVDESCYALSHRWESRNPSMPSWLVYCDEEAPYECLLQDSEAENLKNYLNDFAPTLWLDYICIDQNGDEDKNAQVSIMGSIYARAVSLIVGEHLSPKMPPRDYLSRAWCIQERSFGSVKFPWNFDECDGDYLITFAETLNWRVPHMRDLKIRDRYDYTENWRVKSLQDGAENFPEAGDEIRQITRMMTEGQRDKVAMARLSLRIRELISCDDLVEPVYWHSLMFACSCSFPKDKLYGVWGVPMYMKGVDLPYDDPVRAWNLILEHYPQANFALYHNPQDPHKPLPGHVNFNNVNDVMAQILGVSSYSEPERVLQHRRYWENDQVVISVGEECVAFGWHKDPTTPHSHVPVFLVIHRDALLCPQPDNRLLTYAIELFRDRFQALGGRDTGWGQPFGIKHEAQRMLGMTNPHD